MNAVPFVASPLALLGAGLSVLFLVVSTARAVRTQQSGHPVRLLPVAIGILLTVFLAILPTMRLLVLVAPARFDSPRILSDFGDLLSAEGYLRLEGPNRGLDVAGFPGTPVLAAAGGRVVDARPDADCGTVIVIDHAPYGYQTIYCHVRKLAVQRGADVVRGQFLGVVRTSADYAWPGYEHLHWELHRDHEAEDPVPWVDGCFHHVKPYRSDRLVLTYPVAC